MTRIRDSIVFAESSALRRHVDLEPFLGQFRDGAVSDRRLDGGVELSLSSVSSLRTATATPRPRTPPETPAAGDHHALELGLIEGRLQGRMRGEDRIDPACREIEIMLLGGLVFADRHRVLEVFFEELRVDGRALRSDRLALENGLPGFDDLLRAVGILVEIGRARPVPASFARGESFMTAKPCMPDA